MKINEALLAERYEELCLVSMAVEQELAIMRMVMAFEPTTIGEKTYTFVAYNMDEETITLQCSDAKTGECYMPTWSFEQFEQTFYEAS